MGNLSRAAAAVLALGVVAAPGAAQAQSGNIYGAIAYSNTTGVYGYSHNYPNRGSAQSRALGECHAGGGGGACQVVIWFYNACGAIATGSSYGWGAGYAPTRQQASSIAMGYCRQNDYDCRVRQTVCSF